MLISPYHLEFLGNPSIVDTLDERLQMDPDTLKLYTVNLAGTTENTNKMPTYTKRKKPVSR